MSEQLGLAGLGEQHDVGLDLGQLGAGFVPKAGGHLAGDVAPEAVQVEGGGVNPVLEHGDHVFAELRVGVIKAGDVGPLFNRRADFAGGVMLVELGVLHEHAVPRGVVGDNVNDDLEAALVGLGNQALEVGLSAVVGVDGVVVADGVGAAEGAFAHLLADGIDGHQPEDVDAEVLQLVQAGGDAVEVAFGGEVAREDFIDYPVAHPLRAGAGGFDGLGGKSEQRGRQQGERQG